MNTLHFGITYVIIYKICCPYLTRKPTLSIFHQVINVVVMRKTFQDFVSFWYKLCLFERQLNYVHIDTNHYVVS